MDLTLDTDSGKLNIRVAAWIESQNSLLVSKYPDGIISLPGGRVKFSETTSEAVVFCKTFLHNIAKKKYTPLRLKFFSDYFGLDRAFLSRKLSPVKLKMCA